MSLYEKVSIIVPAYNEEDVLVETIEKMLGEIGEEAELIIVEDGCTDQTPKIAAQLAEKYSQIKHIHFDERQGKATAIKKAFEQAKGEILAFADSDTPSAHENIPKIIEPIKNEDYDIVIGSRHGKNSESQRGLLRKIHTTYTNKTISTILGTGVKDHQCGFKAIKREKYEEIKPELKSDKWFLDIELIYHAKSNGYKLKSVPVKYTSDDESSSAGLEIFPEFFKTIYQLKKSEGKQIKRLEQYFKFGVIGVVGAIINTILLYAFTEYLGMYYMLSAFLSIEAAIISMFFLNNKFTFKPLKKGFEQIIKGLIRSNIIRSVGIIVQLGILYSLTEYFGINYLVSNLAGILIGGIFTFYGEKYHNWN